MSVRSLRSTDWWRITSTKPARSRPASPRPFWTPPLKTCSGQPTSGSSPERRRHMGALNDVLEEAVRMTAEATVAEIERLARQAALDLLNAALPPIVHANAGAVKAT